MSHSDTTRDKGLNTIELTGRHVPAQAGFDFRRFYSTDSTAFMFLDPWSMLIRLEPGSDPNQVTNPIGHDEQVLISDLHNDG